MPFLGLLCAFGAVSGVQFARHNITTSDGTVLHANSYAPDGAGAAVGSLPLVVMVNSWGFPSTEYLYPCSELAEKNYIAVEYAARGWWGSGGEIDTAGPLDISDHAAVISWALQHWGDSVNASAIATGGISYGAGISLIAASVDPRIVTVFAFSGWASLLDALWWNQAPSLFWSHALVDIGRVVGREPAELRRMLDNVMHHTNINETEEWTGVRLPRTYLPQLLASRKPVLLSNQFEDNLFHSNFQLELWQALQGPKRLFLNQGTHGEAESSGRLPFKENQIWVTAFAWLDRFLKGIDNGVEEAPLVQVSLSDHHDPLIPGKPKETFANYSSWPPVLESEKYAVQQYSLVSSSVAGTQFGKLVEGAGAGSGSNTVAYTNNTRMNCGLPYVTPSHEPRFMKTVDILKLDASFEVALLTAPLEDTMRVCGNFNVTGLVGTANTDRFQVMGYLWSVKEKNFFGAQKAALLSHAPQDIWMDAKAGKPFAMRDLTFHAACRDLKKGESLMLGFNLHNGRYEGANSSASVSVQLDYSKAVLSVPTVATSSH